MYNSTDFTRIDTMIYACAACFSKGPIALWVSALLFVWSLYLGYGFWRHSTEGRAVAVINTFIRDYTALTNEVVTLSEGVDELVETLGQTKSIVELVQQQQLTEALAIARQMETQHRGRRASF
jgi:hypothetical protein